MKSLLKKSIFSAFAAAGIAMIFPPSSANAQQGWSGYGGAQVIAPPAANYTYTYPTQGTVWQGYTPGTAWSGPAYAPSGPVVATAPVQQVYVPGVGWTGYDPSPAWSGYTPSQAWTGYTPGYISVVPRSERPRYDRRLLGWGWTGGGTYSEPGTGRSTPMLKPWLPGAAGS